MAPYVRVKVWSAVIRAQLSYGCESWVLSTRIENMLRSFQQRHLRHIMGMHPKVTATTFEYPRREDVLRAAGVPDIVDFVRFRQVVFAGHALRSKYGAKAYLTAQPADRKSVV